MLRIDKALSQKIIPWLAPVLIAVFLLYVINKSFLQLAVMPSNDMQQSYSADDLVLLNKFSSTYNKNDILAFGFYKDDSTTTKPLLFIQRCVALPNDTLELDNGFVYINNNEDRFIPELKHNYHLKTKLKLDSSFLMEYNLVEGGIISDENDYSYSLTQYEADSLRKDSMVIELTKSIERTNLHDQLIFPNDSNHKWNKHNYGKIYIPKKDDVIKLDTLDICLYKKIISGYEKNKLEVKDGKIFINDIITTTYTIKQNYYFVLGDNRDNAIDSRYFGFLPETNIIGKVMTTIHRKK